MKIKILLVIFWVSRVNCDSHSHESKYHGMEEKFNWASLNFQFPNTTIRDAAISSGSYIPKNNNILAIGVWREKIFAAIFRFGLGVASGLSYFDINNKNTSPILKPYPSFDANYVSEDPLQRTTSLPSNSSVISGGYMDIDKCDRLWIADSGLVDYSGKLRVIAPPALLIFNLKTNQLIRRFVLPAKLVNSNSQFGNLVVDVDANNCNDAYAYLADMFRAIVVYSFKKDRAWRVVHSFFGSDPQSGNFFYEQLNYQWSLGVLGLAIGRIESDRSRRVYVSAFSSTELYYISNRVLQNETYIAIKKYYYDFLYLGDRGAFGQVSSLAYDVKTGVLFDSEVGRGTIGCWNSETAYTNTSFGVVYKNDDIFFPEDIDIDRKRNLWVLANRLPVFMFGTWDSTNTKNIRIFKQNLDYAIKKTVCHRCKKH